MSPFRSVPLLLTFASSFAVAQVLPPKPVEASVPARQTMLRCKASNLIGCTITNPKNESLGEIEDIVLDARNQRVAYVVVGFGGVLGMGEKYFALPWRLIEIVQRSSDDLPRVTLGLDHATLKAAPGFDKANWPDMANPTWAGRVDAFYRDRNEGEAPAGDAEPKGSAKDGTSGVARPPASAAFAHRRFTQIIGTRVVDAQHARIADVEDLVVGSESARIEGVLLSFGGVLGMGESTALVPADSLTYDAAKHAYVLPCSAERLAAMALKDGKWPALGDDGWLKTGREACLLARKESDAKATVVAIDAAMPVGATPKYDLTKVETMNGTIVTVGTVTSGNGSVELLRLRVKLADAREVVVHAGPTAFAPQRLLDLRPGRRVEVVGALSVFESRTILLAGELEVDGKRVSLRDESGMPTWLEGK